MRVRKRIMRLIDDCILVNLQKSTTTGKPTTGSKGILLNDLLKSLTTPSKTQRSKKSDNKKPRNTNNDKPAAPAALKPEL